MARRYPPEVHAFIKDNVVGRTTKELVILVNKEFNLGFTESAMRAYKKNHHLKSGTPCGLPAGHPSRVFPQEVCNYIRDHYSGVGHQQMADQLNRIFGTSYTAAQVKAFYTNHKLNSGLTGRFEKGHVPANKGKKGVSYPGMEATQFKKGNLPPNTRPIGWERISKDGYVEVKVRMRPSSPDRNDNFVPKHRLIWEQAHGTIPPGHVVIFKDGDRRNFDLENLAIVTMAERLEMQRHGLFSSDPQLTESGIAVSKTLRAISEKKKQLKKGRNK